MSNEKPVMAVYETALIQFFKRADILHPKYREDARVRTSRGGLLFILASFAAFILATNSVISYFSQPLLDYVERIEVDTQLARRMPIELSITFPRLSCVDVELVAMDVSGETQLDVSSDLHKTRLSPTGEAFGDKMKGHINRDKLAMVEKFEEHSATKKQCGSCYGAELGPDDCCTTCHDVRSRYSKRGWDVQRVSREAEQCLKEIDHPEIAVEAQEGCNIQGTVSVNKVAGNIHVALGTTRKINGQLIHTFVQDQMGDFDTSHFISKVRFGDVDNALSPATFNATGPLDGVSTLVDQSLGKTAAIQYFVHLIPVKIEDKLTYKFTKTSKYVPVLEPEHRASIEMNTENMKHTAAHGPKKNNRAFILPGVYIIYDFSPFVVVRERYHVPFIDLVTDLLTVAGSVFALVRMLDSGLHRAGL